MYEYVTKIFAGRERKEREKGTGAPRSARLKGQTRGPSARFQPAAGGERALLPQLAILCAARLPPAPLLLPPAKFLSRAAKSFSRAPNRFLTRLFEGLSPKSNPEQTPPNPSSATAPSTSPSRCLDSPRGPLHQLQWRFLRRGLSLFSPKGLISFLRWASLPGRPSLFYGRSNPWRPSLFHTGSPVSSAQAWRLKVPGGRQLILVHQRIRNPICKHGICFPHLCLLGWLINHVVVIIFLVIDSYVCTWPPLHQRIRNHCLGYSS